MKKIMIAFAAVVMAACAQAAAVSWNSGIFNAGFTSPDGSKVTTAMGYTVTVSFFSDAAGENIVATSTSSSANGMTGAFTATTGDLFDNKAPYYVQAVMSSADYTRETEILAFTMPDTGNASLNFTTGAGLSVSGNQWGAYAAVPEPTSGLLLLLGMAGLALRRKQK